MRCPVAAIGTKPASNALHKRHEATMRRFIDDVANNGDYFALKELVHPDYIYRAPGQELRGLVAIQALFETYRVAFPDLHIDIDELVATGDRVALAFTLTGTHKGALMGIDASGNRVEVHGTVFSRFEAGQIVEEWEVIDQLSLFNQLGFLSLPG
jgi:steroid delta-isomerase-like uncharacterized protein